MNSGAVAECGHGDLVVRAWDCRTAGSGHHATGVTDSWATLCKSLDVLVPLESRLNNKWELLHWVLCDHQTPLGNEQ